MTSKTFSTGSVIDSGWLNDVNTVVYNNAGGPGTLPSSSGSSLVGFIQSGTGAVARTVQSQLRDYWTTVNQFGQTVGDGVANDANLIQLAINAVNAAGGGTVYFPLPTVSYNLGTTGLITYPNVRLVGAAQSYTSGTRGVVLLYSGTGNAILGTNMLNGDIENISIDATNSTGVAVNGIYLKGAWLSTLRNVRVKGVPPAKGYGILIDTNAGTFGAQHNYLERVETADGIIRLSGTSGSDEVTTTVFNTVRGNQYQINNSQMVAINATVGNNSWTGKGWDFQGASDGLLLHCDIEGGGVGDTGINVSASSVVRELGTTWGGFTGSNRVVGALANWKFYNSGQIFQNLAQAIGAMPAATWQDQNASYVALVPQANNVGGGTQDGNFVMQRNVGGAGLINQFEWRDQYKIQNTKAGIQNAAVTILTVPVPAGGIRLKVFAQGAEPGVVNFSHTREAVVSNNAGALAVTAGNELKAGAAYDGVISFAVSGANILVQFNFVAATAPATIAFVIEIDGPITGYTKG